MIKKLLVIITAFASIIFFSNTAFAQITTVGGGTGTTSPSGILYGVTGNLHLQTLRIGTGLTFTGTTLNASATGASTTLLTDSNTFSGTLNSFTHPPAFTTLTGLLKGNGASAITAGVNGIDFTLLTANTCGASQFFNSATAAGVLSCGSLGTLGVANGGTGATTFGQGWLFSVGGTGALAASTSPTVNYITATSTTATSTFAFSINVNSGAVATNNKYLARPAFIYSTTTPGSNDSIVFTGARDSAPSFSGTTLTLPSNIYAIQVEIWGGGAGGASGSVGNSPTNPDPNAGTNGSQTCFSTSSSACSTIASTNIGAMGGSAGAVLGVGDFGSPGGGGGIGSSTADIFLQANPSLNGVSANTGISANGKGGIGGSAPLGGGGGVGVGTRPITAASNGGSPGGGGGGGFGVPDGSTPAVIGGGGGGGGGGGYAEKFYTSIIPYFYTIGIGGIGGAGYSNGGPFTSEPGGSGAAGGIKITGYTY